MYEQVNPLIRAGFTMEHILEPLSTDEFKEKLPEDYDQLIQRPGFMCLRAVKG
jgi:hypothetical protein